MWLSGSGGLDGVMSPVRILKVVRPTYGAGTILQMNCTQSPSKSVFCLSSPPLSFINSDLPRAVWEKGY